MAQSLSDTGNDAHLTLQCFEAMLIIPQPSELEETVQNLAETYTTLNNQLSQKLVEYKNVSTGLEQLKRRAETLTTDIGKAKDRQQQLDKVMKENKLQLSKTIQRLDEIKNFVKQYGPLLAATSTAGDQKQDNAAKNSPAPSTSEEQNPSGTQKNVPSQTSPPSSTSQSATGDSATIAALEAQIDADTGSKMDSDPEKSDPVSETSASSSSSQVATLETQTDADVEFKKDDDSEKGDSVTTSSCEDQSGEEDSK